MELHAVPPFSPTPAQRTVLGDAVPVESGQVRRAPSSISIPSLDDGSASASAALDQVASYITKLQSALGDGSGGYARLIKRGFLESAIDNARFALGVIHFDKDLDNDGFDAFIEATVVDALVAVKGMGTPTIAEPNLADELSMAGAAATNAARGLEAYVLGA